MEMFAPMMKALVPLMVSVALTILGGVGLTPEMTLEQIVTLFFTSVLVYFVPNKK